MDEFLFALLEDALGMTAMMIREIPDGAMEQAQDLLERHTCDDPFCKLKTERKKRICEILLRAKQDLDEVDHVYEVDKQNIISSK